MDTSRSTVRVYNSIGSHVHACFSVCVCVCARRLTFPPRYLLHLVGLAQLYVPFSVQQVDPLLGHFEPSSDHLFQLLDGV